MTPTENALRRADRRLVRGLAGGELCLDLRAVEKWSQAVHNRRTILSQKETRKRRRRLSKWWRIESRWALRTTRPAAEVVMRFA